MTAENHFRERSDRFTEVISYHAEDDIMVLKGHLLAEELLNVHSLSPKNFDVKVNSFVEMVFASEEVKVHLDDMVNHTKFTMDMY